MGCCLHSIGDAGRQHGSYQGDKTMKRALTIATLACSVLLVGAMNTSEARPRYRSYQRHFEQNYRQARRNYRNAGRRYRNHYNRYSNRYNRYNRRYNNHYYRGNGAGFYTPGFGFYYGW